MSDQNFKQDIIDLFSGRLGGHVQRYCYGNGVRGDGASGSGLWHHFVSAHDNYYPINAEIALIPDLVARLDDRYDTVVDFGIGDEKAVRNKMLPILASQKGLKRYTAIDDSRENLPVVLKF